MSGFPVKTINGYDFFEVTSAFQKSVRRCNEEQAMFWAIELHKSNYVTYIWERMLIMTSEDIGLAEPYLPQRMMALKQTYDLLAAKKKKSTPEMLPFIHAILSIVRAKKSRFIDLAFVVYWRKHKQHTDSKGKYWPIPEYAFDMHTRKGKQKGHGLDHFYKEGAKVNNKADIHLEVEFEKLAVLADKMDAGILSKEEYAPIPDSKDYDPQFKMDLK